MSAKDKRAFGSFLVLTSIHAHNYMYILFNLVGFRLDVERSITEVAHLQTFNFFAAKSNTKYCSKVLRLRIVTNAKHADAPVLRAYLLDQNSFRLYFKLKWNASIHFLELMQSGHF